MRANLMKGQDATEKPACEIALMKTHALFNWFSFHHCKGKLYKYFTNTPF